MRSLDPHGKQELIVFNSFSNVVDIPIIAETIAKQDVPYADIICKIEGEGFVAFELGALIPEEKIKSTALWFSTIKDIEDSINDLDVEKKAIFDHKYDASLIHFFFYKDLKSVRKRRKSIRQSIAHLLALPNGFEGFTYAGISQNLKEISVFKGKEFKKHEIETSTFNDLTDPTELNILNKIEKKYKDDCPIELLAHFKTIDVSPEEIWSDKVRNICNNLNSMGPFRRIWFFDETKKSIKYVYPST